MLTPTLPPDRDEPPSRPPVVLRFRAILAFDAVCGVVLLFIDFSLGMSSITKLVD